MNAILPIPIIKFYLLAFYLLFFCWHQASAYSFNTPKFDKTELLPPEVLCHFNVGNDYSQTTSSTIHRIWAKSSTGANQDTDTDNNGLVDYIDTDSDNDGCADYIEGGGNFTTADGTAAVGILTDGNGDVANENFGTTVDTNSTSATYDIPVVAGSGQTVGISQNSCVVSASVYAIQPSCINGVPQNDGYLQLSAITSGTRYNWSVGSTYTGDPDFADAIDLSNATLPLQFNTGVSNPSGSQDYTVRIFGGISNCDITSEFIDYTITMNEQDCMVGCNCEEYIYLNEPAMNATLKFRINPDGSTTEILDPITGAHWSEGQTISPHGLGTDLNGFLYISNAEFSSHGNSDSIRALSGLDRYNCDGDLIEEDFLPPAPGNGTEGVSGYATNVYSVGNTIYMNNWYRTGYNDAMIFAYDICTKELLGTYTVCDDTDALLLGWDFHIDEDNNKIIINNYRSNGIAIGDLEDHLNGDCIPIVIDDNNRRGITMDEVGNIYARNLNHLSKYNSTYELQYTIDLTINGGANAWAIVYSETTGYLYLAGNDADCISVYNATDGSYVMQAEANPPNASPNKAIAIIKECCPVNNRQTIEEVYCEAGNNERLFLNELLPCDGVICQGTWIPNNAASAAIYDACNQSISENIAAGCYTFTKSSEGLEKYPRCGAFEITFNLEILESPTMMVSANQTICDGDTPAPLTVTTTATAIQWQMSRTSCSEGFTNIAGATMATYQPMALNDTTYYRVVITETGACSSGECIFKSDCIIVTSNPMPIATDDILLENCPGQEIEWNVSLNDIKALDNYKYSLLTPPVSGVLTFDTTGNFTYQPANFDCYTDQFSYQLCYVKNNCCDTASVTLNLSDNTVPKLLYVPEDLTISCDEELPNPPLIFAIDNCPVVSLNAEEQSTQEEGGCFQQDYTLTRTWTATDQCGNTISDEQVIEIQDVTAPDIFRIYTLSNGKKIVAGVMENVNQNWKTIPLPIDFPTTPIIFSQAITTNESTPITTQIQNVSISQFELNVEEEAGEDNIHQRENVAWIAIEKGANFLGVGNGLDLKDDNARIFGETGSIPVDEKWIRVTTKNTYYNPVVIAGISENMSGNSDRGKVRIQNVTANSFDMQLQEWSYLDVDQNFESISYIVIEGSIPLDASLMCQYGTDSLELGKDIIALDNCDVNVALLYEENELIDRNDRQIIRTWYAEDECGNSTGLSQIVSCTGVGFRSKLVLQGAMLDNNSSNLMRDDLRKQGLLPIKEPYSAMQNFDHVGAGGGEECSPEIFDITGEKAIVDWVFIELKQEDNQDAVVATRAALLQRNGHVISANGASIISFDNLPPDNYYIAIRHRNHLKVETLHPFLINDKNIPFVDFSDIFLPTIGHEPFIEQEGKNALWGGDLNQDEQTIYQGPTSDVFQMFLHVFLDTLNQDHLTNFINKGYTQNDFNLDGVTIYQGPNNDRSKLLFNTTLEHPDNDLNAPNFIISTDKRIVDVGSCLSDKTLPNCDFDGDEKLNRTDSDDDNDGVIDGNDTDPYNPESDSDSDTITDIVETQNGTNPLNPCDPLQHHDTCVGQDLDNDGKFGNYPLGHSSYDDNDRDACIPNLQAINCGCPDNDMDGYINVCHRTKNGHKITLLITLDQWITRQAIGDICGECP